MVGYALGLVWGQLRLSVAAIKSLADYRLLKANPVISVKDEQLKISAIQKWYLKRFMRTIDGTNPPLISADVKWNWGVVARVNSAQYIGFDGAESLDGLYVCLFGAWLRVHTFSHAIA